MLKVSTVAMIATLTIGVSAIIIPTLANAAFIPPTRGGGCTVNCDPGPGDPGNNDPGDEGDPDDDDTPDDGDDPEDGDDPGDPGDAGDPGPDGIPGTGDEPKRVVALDCAIKDEQALTTDLWLLNVGTVDLEAGMKIRYSIPATGEHGAFYLPKTIEAGKEGRLSDFIKEIPVGEDCRVEIIL